MIKRKFFYIPVLVLVFTGPSPQARETGKPSWLKKTIIPQGDFIFSVGHSKPADTEEDARNEALSKATQEFFRYCKVDVQSFDRSIELYAKEEGKEFSRESFESQGVIRARAFVSRAIPEDWYVRKEKKKFRQIDKGVLATGLKPGATCCSLLFCCKYEFVLEIFQIND